jgi:hypothetical protein
MVVLSRNGEVVRTFALPGLWRGSIDFAVNASGEILYRVEGDLVAVDINGEIVRVVPGAPSVRGNSFSPYARRHISKRHVRDAHYQVFGEDFTAQKTVEFEAPSDATPSEKVIQVLPYGTDEAFVRRLVSRRPRVERVTLNAANGALIANLPDCAKFSADVPKRTLFRVDGEGNLYEMEMMAPIVPESEKNGQPVSTDEPFLRIWKWSRTAT